MVKKIITWVDLQGRYRVTSPAYDWLKKAHSFTEDDAINWGWTVLVEAGGYGIQEDHALFLVEDTDQRERLRECCGTYFRYGVFMLPNHEGLTDQEGKVILKRDARDGAWEMDTDGRPRVNMSKAIGVQMDYIRKARDKQLAVLDGLQNRAVGRGDEAERIRSQGRKQVLLDIPQTFDLSAYTTPETLKAAWPAELPARPPMRG